MPLNMLFVVWNWMIILIAVEIKNLKSDNLRILKKIIILLGYGSVLNIDGIVQMDASIMDGQTLQAGCTTLVEDILNPITLARRIMESSNHTFLGGAGAMRFACSEEIPILTPPGRLVTEYSKQALEDFKRDMLSGGPVNGPTEVGKRSLVKDYGEVGTVGAVAIDKYGNVAAATSTGGMTGKLSGRIGDTPLLGSGTYADNLSGAVSTTGHGESIMRFNVASRILQRMEYLGESGQVATAKVLTDMTERLGQTAGAITVDNQGNLGIFWTSEKMAWAYQKGNRIHYGIRKEDDFSELA